MAIAFGAALGTVNTGGVSSRSLTSLSVSGSNIVIIVGVRTETTSKTVSSLNWDDGSGGSAQAFTQLGTYKDAESNNHRMSLWYLANPNTSNSRIICTINANDTLGISAAYWTGVAQSSIFTTPSQGGPTTYSSQTQADTSDANGSWHIGASISGNGGWTMVQGTSRQIMPSTGAIFDSNATVANGVGHTFEWSGGSTTAWITAMMRPVATTDYTMVAALGTYVLTGIDATFHIAVKIIAALGTFTLTGIDAAFSLGKGIIASVGTFTLTGIDAAFHVALTMSAAVGDFVLTGVDAVFHYGRVMAAATGSFILTGFAALFPWRWAGQVKNLVSWTDQDKNSSTWTNQNKNDQI